MTTLLLVFLLVYPGCHMLPIAHARALPSLQFAYYDSAAPGFLFLYHDVRSISAPHHQILLLYLVSGHERIVAHWGLHVRFYMQTSHPLPP